MLSIEDRKELMNHIGAVLELEEDVMNIMKDKRINTPMKLMSMSAEIMDSLPLDNVDKQSLKNLQGWMSMQLPRPRTLSGSLH